MKTGLLVADADAELRWIYGRLSSVLGFHVETAADGLDCWNKLRGQAPAALIVDMDIPWGGGDGVLARLQEDGDGTRPLAVFVTGSDPPDVVSGRFGIPVERCYRKPYRLSALLDSVQYLLAADSRFQQRAG